MKKALLLCASHNDLGLIKALRKLGFYIIATGNVENLPGEKWVDKYIKADYSDQELILDIAKKEGIGAICPCCNDYGVYTAAYVAEQLGLKEYDSYETTCILHNKDRFKKFAEENGILSPISHSFICKEDALNAVENMEYPIIIKPTDASAGNGINKVENVRDASSAIEIAFSKSRLKKIVIEPFIKGTQHGFCTYLINKKVVACCTNNEYSILNPYRVEIDTYPATSWKLVYDILIEQIEKIADILQLKDGIFHLQYILKDGKPWIIEVMRRVLGNMYSVPANMLNGLDWDYWEVRARCGLGCKGFPNNVKQEGFYAYKTILANKNGIVQKINIPKKYEKYIFAEYLLHGQGDIIKDYKKEPIGFLFMMFADEEQMKAVLIDDYSCNLVEVQS